MRRDFAMVRRESAALSGGGSQWLLLSKGFGCLSRLRRLLLLRLLPERIRWLSLRLSLSLPGLLRFRRGRNRIGLAGERRQGRERSGTGTGSRRRPVRWAGRVGFPGWKRSRRCGRRLRKGIGWNRSLLRNGRSRFGFRRSDFLRRRRDDVGEARSGCGRRLWKVVRSRGCGGRGLRRRRRCI